MRRAIGLRELFSLDLTLYVFFKNDKMPLTKQALQTKIHLIISVIIVIPISLVYGFNPASQFDIQPNTIDEHNFFKAIMGLYLGFAMLWILGIFKQHYFKIAVLTNMLFMLGLGVGRLLSISLDGTPTFGLLFGTFGELFLGCYGIWVLKIKNTNFAKK